MNRSKKFLTKEAEKHKQKEIRLAQRNYSATRAKPTSDQIQAEALLAQTYRPLQRRLAGSLRAVRLATRSKTQQQSRRTATSKRSSPEMGIPRSSSPKHIHEEGTRWAHTLIVQNGVRSQRLTRKLSRKK